MKKIFTGTTGCGKTFQGIKLAKSFGRFVYMAPCRQLVYETALKYGSLSDSISTGECHLEGKDGNLFAVYETQIDINKYNSIVVDEAHFITDRERGYNLQQLIQKFEKANKNVILLTATQTFYTPTGYEEEELYPMHQPKFKEVGWSEFCDRANAGIPTIYFMKYKDEWVPEEIDQEKIEVRYITADTSAVERLQNQIDFANGKCTFIMCTNVLAQGLNFPAQNIYIRENKWDSDELIIQKLGRLGRYGTSGADSINTFCLEEDRQLSYSKRHLSDYTPELNNDQLSFLRFCDLNLEGNDFPALIPELSCGKDVVINKYNWKYFFKNRKLVLRKYSEVYKENKETIRVSFRKFIKDVEFISSYKFCCKMIREEKDLKALILRELSK